MLILIRLTGFPDLTVDGSFTIGAAFSVLLLVKGYGTPIAILGAVCAGCTAGLGTWCINHLLGVGKVVSGVLSMVIFVLLAPYVATSTMSLYRVPSIFSFLDRLDRQLTEYLAPNVPFQLHPVFSSVILTAFFAAVVVVYMVFSTNFGLRLRYVGSAISPVFVSHRQRSLLTLVGLMSGNAMVAVGGAIESQRRGGYSANMGIGMILIAMTILILGESIVKTSRKRDYLYLSEYLIAVVLGCLIYSIGIESLLRMNFVFADLKLITNIFLLLLLGVAGRFYSSSTRLF